MSGNKMPPKLSVCYRQEMSHRCHDCVGGEYSFDLAVDLTKEFSILANFFGDSGTAIGQCVALARGCVVALPPLDRKSVV